MARADRPQKKKYPVAHDTVIDVSLGHFFMTPNALMQRFAAAMKPDGVSVYMALKTFTTADDPSCFPSYHLLAEMTGISRRQVLRSIERLESLGLVAVHHRRRTDTNIYVLLPLPPASASDSQSLVQPSASDSQSLVLVTHSHYASDSQSPKEYPPKNTHLKKTHHHPYPSFTDMTPSAPKSQDVVVVDQPVAIAQGEETTATDSGIGHDAPTPFDTFFVAYPHHRAIQTAQKAWQALDLDARLSTILEALAWQQTLTGHEALPLYPHVYLQNQGWRDARPVATGALADPDAPRCKVPACEEVPSTLSDCRCDAHAMAYITDEAPMFHDLLNHYAYKGADLAARDEALLKKITESHPACADAILSTLLRFWENSGHDLTADSIARDVIAPMVRSYRGTGPVTKLVV